MSVADACKVHVHVHAASVPSTLQFAEQTGATVDWIGLDWNWAWAWLASNPIQSNPPLAVLFCFFFLFCLLHELDRGLHFQSSQVSYWCTPPDTPVVLGTTKKKAKLEVQSLWIDRTAPHRHIPQIQCASGGVSTLRIDTQNHVCLRILVWFLPSHTGMARYPFSQ